MRLTSLMSGLNESLVEVVYGTVVYEDGVLSVEPESDFMLDIIDEPIFVYDREVDPDDDPEVFVRGLCMHYKSYAMRASEAV